MDRETRDKGNQPERTASSGGDISLTGRDQARVPAPGALVYTNSLGTYSGATAHEILEALHKEARIGWDVSFTDWKKWNKDNFEKPENPNFPLEETPEAEARFLEGLVLAGVLKPST